MKKLISPITAEALKNKVFFGFQKNPSGDKKHVDGDKNHVSGDKLHVERWQKPRDGDKNHVVKNDQKTQIVDDDCEQTQYVVLIIQNEIGECQSKCEFIGVKIFKKPVKHFTVFVDWL